MSASLSLCLTRHVHAAALWNGPREELLARNLEAQLAAARQEGRCAGERAARNDAARLFEQASAQLDERLDEAREELARQAVELALGIAGEILRVELSAQRHDIERIVRGTLAQSGVGRGACVVHLHPLDVERLRHVAFRSGTCIEADEDVPVGSVHVTTPKGLLVREVDACLAAVAERLRGELS